MLNAKYSYQTKLLYMKFIVEKIEIIRIHYVCYSDSFKSQIHIGAYDIDVEGTWRWVDGSLVDLNVFSNVFLNNADTDFPTNDPARRYNADCGSLWNKLHFNDQHCESAAYYACELSL